MTVLVFMKILHIFDHSIPLQSGYTFRSRAILEQQRAMGWETEHVTSIKHTVDSSDENEVDGFHFYRTCSSNGLFSKLPVLNQFDVVISLVRRLDQIITVVKPDILHAHSPCLNGLAALKVARKYKLPVVYECRAFWEDAAVDHGTSQEGGARYRLGRLLETYVFNKANAVTTICEGLRADILNRGIAPQKVTVIPNAVNISRFSAARSQDRILIEKFGLEGKSVLGFIGSFYAYEGLPLLLDAMPIILKALPEARLLLVGGGPQEQLLKQKAQKMGLSNTVFFTGRVPHEKVQSYYDLIDIFVYPRLHMRLTDLVTPLKPLEAMAQKRLVVASDVGGHKELIRDGENGCLFPAGDANALAQRVLALFSNRDGWPRLQEAGRQYVESERNWPVSVGRYKSVYESVIRQ